VNAERYAVAVRDGKRLFLFMWVERSKVGDVYSFLPRPHEPSINAHSSHHASGEFHVKTHGLPQIMHQRRQKPDQNFAGANNLLDQKITQTGVRAIGQDCELAEWSDVFEIASSDLGDGSAHNTHVTADIIADGSKPELVPNARVIRQARYRHSSPFLVFTLYAMPLVKPNRTSAILGITPAPNPRASVKRHRDR
jgi:hypothetical protein